MPFMPAPFLPWIHNTWNIEAFSSTACIMHAKSRREKIPVRFEVDADIHADAGEKKNAVGNIRVYRFNSDGSFELTHTETVVYPAIGGVYRPLSYDPPNW
jgi:hypothetical protein